MREPALKAMTIALVLGICPAGAQADAWLQVGDGRLRSDLAWLADAGVIDLPVNAWPVSVPDLARALDGAGTAPSGDGVTLATLATLAALDRVRHAMAAHTAALRSVRAGGGRPGLLRDFDAQGREEGELGVNLAAGRGRWSAALALTAAASPADHQPLRLDGSHLTGRFGNWLLGAGALDRWWGPGQESSLILSNNARPMPALFFARATSTPFDSAWLRWVGAWRLEGFLARMEGERQDVDRPLFLGLRLSLRPLRGVEIGLSRTAQFCGRGRPCDLTAVRRLLVGDDNAGLDVSVEDEPGNQMAGFDLRLRSPWRAAPFAVYGQAIGEDESSGLPVKLLALFGVETWGALRHGATWRAHLEYSDATCSYNRAQPRFGCAYRNGVFFAEGYRYRGRVIGHTTDNDARLWAVGLRRVGVDGSEWRVKARRADLNRDAGMDAYNSVSTVAADYDAVQIGWRGTAPEALLNGEIDAQLGFERIEPRNAGAREQGLFGFIGWRHSF